MNQENDSDKVKDEEELDQDGIDDFSFLASSENTKSPLGDVSEEFEDNSSSEDESGRRRFKNERKHDGHKKEQDLGQDATGEKKRKRSKSPEKLESIHSKKKERTEKESKHKDSRDKKLKGKERPKEKDRGQYKRERNEEWDHYEPAKNRTNKRDSISPDRKRRSKSPDRRKSSPSRKLNEDRDESFDEYYNDVPQSSPTANGNSSQNTESPGEGKRDVKKEEVYTPSNKYQNRKTSLFAQKIADTKQQIKQPQLPPEEPILPSDAFGQEQPRYRNYSSTKNKKPDNRTFTGDNNFRNEFNTSFDRPPQLNPNDRMFAPQVYAMGLQEYGSAQSMMATSSRALPLTYNGAPPPPGGTLLPGVPVSLQTLNAALNLNFNDPYRGRQQDLRQDSREVRESAFTRLETTTKVPETLVISEERRVSFKKEASRVVVKQLSKYFKLGRIANKDDFKHLSRKLAHKVMKKEESTGFLMTPKTPKKIKKYVDAFFKKHQGVYVKEKKEWEKPLALQAFERL